MRNIFLILLIIACSYPFAGRTASAESFDSNGVKLHYIVEGHGAAVILIHGFHSSLKMN